MELNELSVIVTGAASGLGATFAEELHGAGARVAAGDIDEAALASRSQGIATRRLDVADPEACRAFVAWADRELGGVNALVNNAGVIRDGLLVKRDRTTGEVTTLADDLWQAVIDVNLSGATYMVREVVAAMARSGRRPGVVINMSSVARQGNRGQSNYVAAKAALAANTVTWAREFAPFGVRVAAIAPGVIETPMTRGMNQKAKDALIARVPVGRIGQPHDVWQAVRFIVECDYFNGRCLDVDGGLVM